jgi:hypothetical protein
VQVGAPGDTITDFAGDYLLSERIVPALRQGRFWEVRVFVMAGQFLGGILHTAATPMTNFWQGGTAEPLDDAIAASLERPALEAVTLLDAEADRIHHLAVPPETRLTEVEY